MKDKLREEINRTNKILKGHQKSIERKINGLMRQMEKAFLKLDDDEKLAVLKYLDLIIKQQEKKEKG